MTRFQTMYAKPPAAPVAPDAFQVQVTTPAPSTAFKVGFTSPTDLLVDWGDGNSDTYNTTGVKTHTYASAGTYTVSMSGHAHKIDFYTSATPTLLSAVLTPIVGVDGLVSCANMFYGCTALANLPDDLFRYVTGVLDFNSSFRGCTALDSIPDDLFRYNSDVTSFLGCFYGCYNISTLPADLFHYNPDVTSFANCFMYCNALTAIPAALFDYNVSVSSFAYTFYGCSALGGNAPALWTRDPAPTGTTCFYNCTGLSNYASIPAGWK